MKDNLTLIPIDTPLDLHAWADQLPDPLQRESALGILAEHQRRQLAHLTARITYQQRPNLGTRIALQTAWQAAEAFQPIFDALLRAYSQYTAIYPYKYKVVKDA